MLSTCFPDFDIQNLQLDVYSQGHPTKCPGVLIPLGGKLVTDMEDSGLKPSICT